MAVGNEGRKRKRKVERRGADDRLKPHRPVKKAIELVKNSLSAPMELPTSLYVEADDLDFPREEAEARMEAEDLFERGKKAKTGKKGSKRPPADMEDDLSSLFGNDLRFDHRVPFKIDVDRQSMTLVMKKLYIGNANDDRRHDIGDDHDAASSMEDVLLGLHYKDSLPDYQKISGHDSGGCENLIQSGTRVSVPPLQVILNDSDASDGDNPLIANHNDVNENCEAVKRNRYMKKKVEEEKCVAHVLCY
ncbi:hypothetical protein BHE74_00022462 [Ensete ventricosum]|nr:hypothetical protein BHE74_00022462 [Ensete ventricosum]